jgi:uncharacterized protein (TIGR02246 family)
MPQARDESNEDLTMNPRTYGITLLLGVAVTLGAARAEDPAAIRSRAQEFIKTLSSGNAEVVAAFWTPSGEYARESLTLRGRDNIRKAYAEHFKKKPSGQLSILDDTVRFLSDTVAVQEGTLAVERDNPTDCVRSKCSALWVNSEGKWLLGILREEPEGPSLAELAWMVGDWTFKSDKGEGTLSVQFTTKKTYMLVRTKVQEGEDELVATQVLGIDPATRRLKSWTFESDGSIGTADWVRTETGWLASISATTADGEPVKAVTTITPSSRDAFTFQTTDRTVDGEKVPSIGPVKVTRAAAGR